MPPSPSDEVQQQRQRELEHEHEREHDREECRDEAQDGDDYGGLSTHFWATSMSNAAIMAINSIGLVDQISRVSVEHNVSIKDGSIKRRIEIDIKDLHSKVVRMNATFA